MELKDKVAIITGGASGLGQATAERFVEGGAKVVLFDLNEEEAKKTAENLGENATWAAVNVSDEASVEKGIQHAMQTFKAIHICINCAGIGSAAKTVGRDGAHPLSYFNAVIQVNLVGTFNVLRLAAVEMAKNQPIGEAAERGVIVNTASIAAYDGQMGQVAYSASKGGVVAMTLPIARDLAREGIRVNTIAPGIFNTPMMNGAPDKVKMPLIEMTQFPKRLGHPDEYAKLAEQFVTNSFMNGEVVRIDGGLRMAPR
jgi:3-hydroxyacyl-CoA dehydrogenase/3-hydroxy-2-methylbutyryl-CoA dehydrogenase